MDAHGIMFHHFYDPEHPRGQGAISAETLSNIIQYIGRDNILGAREWTERALTGTLEDSDLCLTFDDALLCQYEVALPVLEDHNLSAFWFVYSSVFKNNIERLEVYRYFRTVAFDDVGAFYEVFFRRISEQYGELVDGRLSSFDPSCYLQTAPYYTDGDRRFRFVRDDVLGPARYVHVMDQLLAEYKFDIGELRDKLWMTDDHLRYLHSSGHVVGLHSYSHPTRMDRLSAGEQHKEYRLNLEHLRSVLSEAPLAMSHPCNAYGPETLDILKELGIRIGFCANMFPVTDRSMLEIARDNHANILKRMGL